jgi:hypothetical protein
MAIGLALAPGCTVCEQTRRTVCQEPKAFLAFRDRKVSVATYRGWAAMAWSDERKSCPTLPMSEEYALGFSDGFTSFVYAGGSGEPPPVPPRQLWNVERRSPPGHAAAQDWFAGYRHGARVAREGGFRDRAIVHSSLGWMGHETMIPHGAEIELPPEDLGPPPPPEPEDEAAEPTLEAPAETPDVGDDEETPQAPADEAAGAEAAEADAATTPEEATPAEAPDSLPAPPAEQPAEEFDETTDNATEFRSALRSVANREAPGDLETETIAGQQSDSMPESPSRRSTLKLSN